MNYSKHYRLLIETRQLLYTERNTQKKHEIYYEKHHIVPRCYGGDNKKENLVWLTAREHFIAHWLLWKIHKDKQMAYAFYCLSTMKQKRKLTSHQYEVLKKMRSKAYSGENSPRGFLGKKHTDRAKEGMRRAKQGKNNPMFGLGQDHPNKRRIGINNPNYGKDPWLNPMVLHNEKMKRLWEDRNHFYDKWVAANKPHWYAFGKSVLLTYPNANDYNPRHFTKMVCWFQRKEQ